MSQGTLVAIYFISMPTRIYRLMSCILSFIILIGVTFSALASTCENSFKFPGNKEEIFKSIFFDKDVYHSLGCAGNAGRLLQQISLSHDISSIKVLILLYEKGQMLGIPRKLRIVPANVRDGIKVWNYHVIVLSEQNIFDFHSSPQGVPMKEYFNRHFPEDRGNKRWEKLMLQVFPAQEYLNSFLQLQQQNPMTVDQVLGKTYISKTNTPENPVLSVSQLLLQNP